MNRRGLLRFGTLLTALTGASAVSAIAASSAHAAATETTATNSYIPMTEKAAPLGVAALDDNAQILPAQLPDLRATFAPASGSTVYATKAESGGLIRDIPTPARGPADPGVVLNDYSNLAGFTLIGTTVTEIATTLPTRERVVRADLPAGTAGAAIVLPVSLDMTNSFVSIPVKVLDNNFQRLTFAISIGDTTFTKRYEYSPIMGTDRVNGLWHTVSFPLTAFNPGGASSGNFLAEARNVKAIKFNFYPVSTAAGTSLELGPIRVHRQPISGLVVMFDDGFQSTHDVAWPIMKDLGLTGNVAVTERYVGTPGYMPLDQLQQLYVAGWGMANHTKAHGQLGTMTPDEVRSSIADGYKYLVNNGMPEDAKHLVYPGGSWNAAVLAECKRQNVRTSRRVGTVEYCTPDMGNMLLLPAWYVTRDKTLASAKSMIDKVVERGGISYLTFHDLNNAPSLTEDWSIADFTALMQYAASKDVRTYRPAEVWG